MLNFCNSCQLRLTLLITCQFTLSSSSVTVTTPLPPSSGQVGPVSTFFGNASAPEQKDAATLGRALFDNESFESWGSLYNVNTFSIFFVTTAFLGLLATGSEDRPGYTSSVINITSISGIMKLSQNHVRLFVLQFTVLLFANCVLLFLFRQNNQ